MAKTFLSPAAANSLFRVVGLVRSSPCFFYEVNLRFKMASTFRKLEGAGTLLSGLGTWDDAGLDIICGDGIEPGDLLRPLNSRVVDCSGDVGSDSLSDFNGS